MSQLLFALALILLFSTGTLGVYAPEKALAKHLLSSYEDLGVIGRPVTKVSDALKVGLGFALNKIVGIDKGYLTVSAMIELEWKDIFLAWNPKDYDGAESIALPADDIWTPDISIWNDYHQNADEQGDEMEEADVLVFHTGKVVWIPRMMYKVPCKLDNKGQFVCTFVAGSWVHETDKIDVDFDDNEADIDMDFYEPTPGYHLVSHSASMEDKEYECCPGEKYTTVYFKLIIKKTGVTPPHAKKEDL